MGSPSFECRAKSIGYGVRVMVHTALAALALGWLIAKRLARRLSQPVTDLADAATRLGDGGAITRPTTPSGVTEIDTLANALADSSERIMRPR